MLSMLWLVLALPLLGAIVLLAGALRLGKTATSTVGVGSVGLALLVAIGALLQLGGRHGEIVTQRLFTWVSTDHLTIDFALRLDPLSAVMLLFVTFVGFLIHVYSVAYMHEESDAGFARYFAYLNLFMFAMLTLVLGASLPVMFIGWEGVGLCSYLLIGYYFDKEFAAAAGKKAFVVNRIGDVGFLLAMFMTFKAFGTLDIGAVKAAAESDPTRLAPVATAVALLLFLGAAGKSAQLPLYVWLPDAMAGPTPVSALIHAATMVTAGVYLVARMGFVFVASPTAMLVVAAVGGLTALVAASIGLAQNDIKKVLAYSTVSQLGLMFLAAGAGAFAAAIFHVFTHAFFKACLFLGSGSVIHACSGEQDIRQMGGLKKHLPTTYWTFLVATLALAGIPVFAGFFSKDEILGRVFAAGAGSLHGFGTAYLVLWGCGLVAAFMTAFYMFRLVYSTFHGSFRGPREAEQHLHESPGLMTWPLRILAVGSAVVGFLGVGRALTFGKDWNVFEHYLAKVVTSVEVEHHPGLGTEWLLIAASVVVALGGIGLARRFYAGERAFEAPRRLAERLPLAYAAVANRYWVDETYQVLIVRPLQKLSWFLWKGVDTVAIDGTLNAGAFFTEITGDLLRFLQTGNARNYALMILAGAVAAAIVMVL